MTTIAWDGKTLAADTQATSSGMPYKAIKLFALADGSLFAGSGDYGQILAVKDWLEGGSVLADRPKADDFAGLLVTPTGEAFKLEDALMRIPLFQPFFAIGSGRDFAMAAMHCGRRAREAIEIATLFDVFTGGEIVAFEVNRSRV
jgi:hypothetical protein